MLYQGFSGNNNGGNNNGNNNTLAAKIAGAIVTSITMVAFASDASGLLGGLAGNEPTQTEAVKTEQLFWESVEKHPSEKLYRDYLKAYPEGKFKDIALAQLVSVAPPAPVAESKQQAAPAPTPSEPVPTTEAAPTPTPSEPVQTAQTTQAAAPTETAGHFMDDAPAPIKGDADWTTIGRYQVKDGLVKDTKTGLMWMRCTMGQTWNGSTCEGEATVYYKKDQIPASFSYEGYDDWHLPTLDELKTLIYCSSGKIKLEKAYGLCDGDYSKPTIDTKVFPLINDIRTFSALIFLTSSVYENNYTGIVKFSDGAYSYTSSSSTYRARFVRSEK